MEINDMSSEDFPSIASSLDLQTPAVASTLSEKEEIKQLDSNVATEQENIIKQSMSSSMENYPTLYQTLEDYLFRDYQVESNLKELDIMENALTSMNTTSANQKVQIQKKLKKIRKLKTFLNQYQIVCRNFLQSAKMNSLSDVSIEGILAKNKVKQVGLEGHVESLHQAFHNKFVRENLLPFIRKSLLQQAKQNVERDKLYQSIGTTEELLLLYQLKHGSNPKLQLSKDYIMENADRKLSNYMKEIDECFNSLNK